MKGLIIKEKWANLILNGDKSIEIRGSKTNIRGKIGIIKSKTKKVFGETELYDCKELDEKMFNEYKQKHKLDITWEELLTIYSKPYAWFLKDVIKYDKPISYNHKQGCVIWVNLN